MSLVRIGMSENKGYADGYEAIFGKRDRFKPAADAESANKPADAAKTKAADKPAEGGEPRAATEGQ